MNEVHARTHLTKRYATYWDAIFICVSSVHIILFTALWFLSARLQFSTKKKKWAFQLFWPEHH
jgi:hypothetical protein